MGSATTCGFDRLTDMTDAPKPVRSSFARELEDRREAAGLTRAAAARRADVSVARWSQVEQGYEKRGGSYLPAKPSRDFVVKVARALSWPRSEALTKAGFPAERLPEDDVDEPAAPARIMTMWSRLTRPQQQALEWMMRLFLDPHSTIDAPPPATSQQPTFVEPSRSNRART